MYEPVQNVFQDQSRKIPYLEKSKKKHVFG